MIDHLDPVDRGSDRAPYRQIADSLRAAIATGEAAPGSKLPSESALMERLGVARMTVRQAIQELRAEGLVIAEHGRGVFVRTAPPVRRLASDRFSRRKREAGKAAFIAEAETSGYEASVDQIEVARTSEAPPFVVERLGVSVGELVIRRSRRYLADSRPVELATSYIPASVGAGSAIEAADSGPGGIYARLEENGHVLGEFVEEVGARMPTVAERRRLELPPGTPVITLVRTAFDVSGVPVEVCDTVKAAPAYVLEYRFPAM